MLGYPIDKRSDDQRAKAAASILGDIEYHAARVVARLTAEVVTLQDDNSVEGMPDIRIDYADGRVGYVEVVTDIDQRYAEMTSTLRKKSNGIPRELHAPQLSRVWFLGLTGHARHGQLDRELPTLLANLEETGHTPNIPSGGREQAESDNVNLRRLYELGVSDISSRPAGPTEAGPESGRIPMFATGASGPARVEWSLSISWLDDLLASELFKSKRDKLGAPRRTPPLLGTLIHHRLGRLLAADR